MYAYIVLITGGMVHLGFFAPRGWEITGVTAVVPLAITLGSHALALFLLNPYYPNSLSMSHIKNKRKIFSEM
jgi:hypothetical protein